MTDPQDPDSETGNGRRATGNGQLPDGTDLQLGADIADRLLDLASGVFGLLKTLSRDPMSKHVGLQLFRSVTSCGANYEEARAAESRSDFIHKLGIAAKEVRETIYWLRLVQRTKLTPQPTAPLGREAIELAAILAASIKTARENA
jgi:four helix bundle protein